MGVIALAMLIPSTFVVLLAVGSARAGAVDDELSKRAARAAVLRRLGRRRGERRQGDRRAGLEAVSNERRSSDRRIADRRCDPLGIDPPAVEAAAMTAGAGLGRAPDIAFPDQLELPLAI